MIGIYKITNPKGKVYIGQSVNIEKRFYMYSLVKNCENQLLLFRSFNKYGVSNHTFEIIEECSVKLLNERERYWQDFYNVLENGLNLRLTKTNDKSGSVSLDTKNKMSLAKKGKKLTEEHKVNLKIARQNSDKYVYKKGHKHSDETKEKMSLAKIGKSRKEFYENFVVSDETKLKLSLANKDKKEVLNLVTGIFYSSVKEASIAYNINYGTLRACLNKRRKNNTNFICI